jgi:hypothetical protein
MPFESDSQPAPPIRGALRSELIRELAVGDQTHEALGIAFGRSTQAIHQFSARNAEEIRLAKQALVTNADQDLADVIELLENGDLTPTQRKGFLGLKSKLRREVAEEKGELPVRSHLELSMTSNPFANVDAVAIDDDGNLHPIRG